jgi:hypothetical protein
MVTGASSGDEVTRRQETVYSDIELRMTLGIKKDVQRCASSPGFFLEGRRRRLLTEAGAVSPIPVSICERERSITGDSDLHSPIPSSGRS